jgi:toxin ParE1/3/4
MNYPVRLREEAEEDLADASLWYEQQQSGLGSDFLDSMLSLCQLISERPLLYPVVHRNVRRALMSRFPFGVYYRTESSHLVIVAVMHASRHPLRWKNRT